MDSPATEIEAAAGDHAHLLQRTGRHQSRVRSRREFLSRKTRRAGTVDRTRPNDRSLLAEDERASGVAGIREQNLFRLAQRRQSRSERNKFRAPIKTPAP